MARTLETYGRRIGFSRVVPDLGPYPLKDAWGVKLACVMVLKSLDPGRNEVTVQFDTVRRLRTAYHNVWHAGVNHHGMTILAQDLKKVHATSCPSDGIWFGRFMRGLEKRMGRQVKQDLGISIDVLLAVQAFLEEDWMAATSWKEKRKISEAGFIFVTEYCLGFRGEEKFLVTRNHTMEVNRYCDRHSVPHFMLGMVGQRKGIPGVRVFLAPCSRTTKSGLEPFKWVTRLLDSLHRLGEPSPWMFSRSDGTRPKLRDYETIFVDYLTRVQEAHPEFIPPELDIGEEYGLGRSGRRGATTQARNQGVSEPDIMINNLWKKTELNVGSSNLSGMLQYYTEIVQSLKTFLRFSDSL